jgi:hypothetical protein
MRVPFAISVGMAVLSAAAADAPAPLSLSLSQLSAAPKYKLPEVSYQDLVVSSLVCIKYSIVYIV